MVAQSKANTLEVARAVRSEVQVLSHDMPKGTELAVTSYYANPDDKPKPGGVKLTVARIDPSGRPAGRGKATTGKALPRQSR